MAPWKRWADLSVVLLPVALVIAFQAFSGAWRSDFTTDEDEAAHAVSSLLIHDYIVHGFPGNPLRYAENFYIHYPKVAIGHWPPLFYGGEAVWMLLFGRTRIAMVTFVGALAIALLVSVFLWVRRDCGTVAALISAMVLALPPFMQSAVASVAPNTALALLAFWAAAILGEYLDKRRHRDAILFAVLCLAAMAVHGRGAAVAFLPVALLFTGAFAWTRMRVLMVLGVIAAALAIPWLMRQAGPPGIVSVIHYAVVYPYRCAVSMSWPAAILAVTGAFAAVRGSIMPRRWLAMPAMVLSGWMFHSLVNAGWDDRYLATAAPAVAALAGAGFHYCVKTFSTARILQSALISLVCAGLAFSVFPLRRKPDLGYHRLATPPGPINLIAGSALHEGAFVSEMALRDPGLTRIALRASKILATSTWMGNRYRLRFSNSAEVLALLDRAHVTTVLLETASTSAHVAQLAAALRSTGADWREVPLANPPEGITAYERVSPVPPGDPEIRIDLRYTLGTTIEWKP